MKTTFPFHRKKVIEINILGSACYYEQTKDRIFFYPSDLKRFKKKAEFSSFFCALFPLNKKKILSIVLKDTCKLKVKKEKSRRW